MPLKLGSQDVTLKLGSQDVTAYLGAEIVSLHPEAVAWRDAVVDNGGSVSGATLAAVSDFCTAIDAAGLRDRFHRLNLFCGDSDASLVAVRTPLYRGPSASGTQYGNAIDTNVNFVAGDYSESAGLTGNTSTGKFLETGILANFSTDRHISVHCQAFAGLFRRLIGVAGDFLITSNATAGALSAISTTGTSARNIGTVDSNAGIQFTAGDIATLADGAPSATFYRNGTVRNAGNDTNTGPSTSTVEMVVFGQGNATGPDLGTDSRLAGYSIGYDMTASQVASYAAICQSFHQSLGRS